MASALSRLSDSSATCLMCSGRLFSAFHLPPSIGVRFPAELRRDHDFSAKRRERFAHKFFVQQRTVHFGGVEECDTPVHGTMKQRNHLLLVLGRSVGPTHSHAAKSDRRYFQIAFSKFALLHRFQPLIRRFSSFAQSKSSERCCSSAFPILLFLCLILFGYLILCTQAGFQQYAGKGGLK